MAAVAAIPRASAPVSTPLAMELWLAMHLPALPLDAVFVRGATQGPCAVVESLQRTPRLVAVDRAARERGMQPGMALAMALALEPRLETRERDRSAERLRLTRFAASCDAFTSRVSVEPPDTVLLEVWGSLALFGGVEGLQRAVEAAAHRLGLCSACAVAPTPFAALTGARAAAAAHKRRGFTVMSRAALVGVLTPLPLSLLGFEAQAVLRLGRMGVTRIGELLRLPRAGLARRFGPQTVTALDRLIGREHEPRRAMRTRARFRVHLDAEHELTDHAAISAWLDPALVQLERYLRERQGSIEALDCRLLHREGQRTRCTLRFAEPVCEATRIAFLLAEKLATLVLPAPVLACELVSARLVPSRGCEAALWRPGEHGGEAGGEASRLIERLRARLGEDRVHGLGLVSGHRPETQWRVAEPAAAGTSATACAGADARRPLWLLPSAQPLEEHAGWPQFDGPLELLCGPERIETGWWDEGEIARDYYVARSRAAVRLWVFRERGTPHAWYLHGIFG